MMLLKSLKTTKGNKMEDYYRAHEAIHQLRSIFDSVSFDAEYSDNLCSDGDVFIDKEAPQWEDRYDHISTHYKKMLDTMRDHLKNMDEYYELKWRTKCGALVERAKIA